MTNELGLLNNFHTGNAVVDTLLCIFISCIVQQGISLLHQSHDGIFEAIYSLIFGSPHNNMKQRYIEITQRFNQYGKVWDYEQKNHILQKAISLYLSDILDLSNKHCIYDLLEKPKKKVEKTDKLNDHEVGSSGSSTDTESYTSSDEEVDTTKQSEVERLGVVALPPLNTWIKVEEGVEFMHQIITPENPGDKKGLTETKINFCFQSALEDGTTRIDAFINKAFTIYQENERKKCVQDKSRYFYIQSGTKPSQSDANTTTVAYKRYVLGEEKTFENLFFDEKEQVLQLLDNFTKRTGKFAIKGFPNKLGLLLHGPPGTGKTSLIKAVAQYTKRHIVTISLGKIKTNQELLDALFDLKFGVHGLDLPVEMSFKDVVFVMEDIDCASKIVNKRDDKEEDLVSIIKPSGPKEEKDEDGDMKIMSALIKEAMDDDDKKGDKLNLSGLLNVLDGVIDCPGRIIIMTTNHPDKLDPALVRPGRVNKKLFLGFMNATQVQHMIEYYCNTKLTDDISQRLHEAFATSKKNFTPAEIEEICVECDGEEQAVENIVDLCQ